MQESSDGQHIPCVPEFDHMNTREKNPAYLMQDVTDQRTLKNSLITNRGYMQLMKKTRYPRVILQ